MLETDIRDPYQQKHSPERRRLATKLWEIRGIDRRNGFVNDRSGKEYEEEFLGLASFFDYIRSIPESNFVLDIGSGKTIGINDISHSSASRGLTFGATSLVRHPMSEQYLGSDNIHITSAEVLRSIPGESVAGILALYSIAYSIAPGQAIQQIDKKLVPGGAFKGKFSKFDSGTAAMFGHPELKDADKFVKALKKLGYDIAVSNFRSGSIVLAIKPGTTPPVSANDLLLADKFDYTSKRRRIFPVSSYPTLSDPILEPGWLSQISNVAVPPGEEIISSLRFKKPIQYEGKAKINARIIPSVKINEQLFFKKDSAEKLNEKKYIFYKNAY